VRGRHDFGGAGAQFGAGRSGRRHQGHDVFARCGTRMVAARGGKVKAKGYQSAAGHYLVITGSRSGLDYFYAHLAEASPFDRGDRVLTGQRIGSVGETGNARGCHLHFELWARPGWYSGGSPFDPLPALREWDSYS
jgi:murein DD-endopeptidase MepM/ murein hydrolase activator NlpD